MIETLSPQWDIGSDNSEALNLAKWGDFLLYKVLPDKITCIFTLISSVYAQILMFLTLNKSDTLETDKNWARHMFQLWTTYKSAKEKVPPFKNHFFLTFFIKLKTQ